MAQRSTRELKNRRHARLRQQLEGTPTRPRVAVFRSNKQISAQVIDDLNGVTLASASSLEKGISANGSNRDGATAVGKELATRLKAAGISQVVFDRGGFSYHGRVAALADALREGGLEF
jgi:large subunit ribosomal protein L18